MQKTDVYVVLTNNTVNAVTMDPAIADQIKGKTPNSIVKKYPMISGFQNGTGIVGEALEGDIDMGADQSQDGSIGQDDVEFADGDQVDGNDQTTTVDVDSEDPVDVICMDVPLAIRMFEYMHEQPEMSDEALHAIVEKMVELGNSTDDVLTIDHYDELVGEQQDDQDFDGDEQDIDGDAEYDIDSDGLQQPQQDQDFDGQEGSDFGDDDHSGQFGQDDDGFDQDVDDASIAVGSTDIEAIGRFMSGELDKDGLIAALQGGNQQSTEYDDADDLLQGDEDDGDEFSQDQFGGDTQGDDDEEATEPARIYPHSNMGEAVGVTTAPQGAAKRIDPALDAQYMRGYNTGKQGGQAQQQNINTPQGAAYNSGFTAGKAGQPPAPPSKSKQESKSASKKHSIAEGVETFASFLSGLDKPSSIVSTVSTIFKQKKQKENTAETHFELEQDSSTSAIKVVNK